MSSDPITPGTAADAPATPPGVPRDDPSPDRATSGTVGEGDVSEAAAEMALVDAAPASAATPAAEAQDHTPLTAEAESAPTEPTATQAAASTPAGQHGPEHEPAVALPALDAREMEMPAAGSGPEDNAAEPMRSSVAGESEAPDLAQPLAPQAANAGTQVPQEPNAASPSAALYDATAQGEPAAASATPPDWSDQPTVAEPPTWNNQPTYEDPAYAPLPQWPGTQPAPDAYAEPAPPEYTPEYTPEFTLPEYGAPQYVTPQLAPPPVPSEYAPPAVYSPPSAYAQPAAAARGSAVPSYTAPNYAPQVYAAPVYTPPPPPPTTTPRLRWPAVVLTVVALAVVIALSLVLAGTALNHGGKTTGPITLYASSMTSSSNDWPTDQECSFQRDGYHITSATNCYYSGAVYQDVTVTVTAKLVAGDPTGAYGIAFRRPSPNKYYVFLVTGDGNWLVARDNVAVVQAQHSSAVKTGLGADNKLAVQMKGSHFIFYANGTRLGDLNDTTYASGNVGLAGDSGIDVAFKTFSVTQP